MTRWQFSREFNIEAVTLVTGGRDGVAGMPGSGIDRERIAAMREAAEAPVSAFPGNGQQRAALAEIAALKTEVAKLQAEVAS